MTGASKMYAIEVAAIQEWGNFRPTVRTVNVLVSEKIWYEGVNWRSTSNQGRPIHDMFVPIPLNYIITYTVNSLFREPISRLTSSLWLSISMPLSD